MSAFGTCIQCGIEVQTQAEAQSHQEETLAAAVPDDHGRRSSHAIQHTHAQSSTPIEDAIETGLQDLFNAIDDCQDEHGISDDEVREALTRIHLESEWEAYRE